MRKLLLLVGVSVMSLLAMGQNNAKVLKSGKISEFKNRMFLSTVKDPLAVLNADTVSPIASNSKKVFRTRTKQSKSLKSATVSMALVDTAYIVPWISGSQQWDTIPIGKIIYTYDNQNNLVNYLSFTWIASSKSWQNNIQIISTYNASNQLIGTYQENWKNKGRTGYGWLNISQSLYSYDSIKRESNYIFQSWDATKNKWVNSWQHQFTYDSLGHTSSILETDWNISANQWIASLNYINQYDSLGKLVLNPIEIRDDSSWVNGAQSIYTYDSLGNNTTMLYQNWNSDSGLWENSELENFSYINSNKINNYSIQLWDASLVDWYNQEQGIYKYDSTGNNTSILFQIYDQIGELWTNDIEYLYEYDSQHNQISNAILNWNIGPGNWYSGTKTKQILSYNVEKSMVEKSESTSTFSTNDLQVYPNPADDFVNIINNAAISEIQVFDIMGHHVFVKNCNGLSNIQIDISNLKPGIYILNIKISDGTTITRRLMKQ